MAVTPLRELGAVFLRIGLTAFGGPAAHVALLRDEFVRRRGWLDDQTFVDLLGAANLIPGPTSTELAMHIGHRRAGWRGLVVAGLAFPLPAVVLVGILAWAYTVVGTLPAVAALLAGVTPVVVAVVAHAGWSLGRTVLRDRLAMGIGAIALGAIVLGVPELLVLLGAGLVALAVRTAIRVARGGRSSTAGVVGWARERWRARRGGRQAIALTATLPLAVAEPASLVFAVGPTGPSLLAVFGVFVQLGAVLFGSGYVLVALLQAELVERLGWLTDRQLLDAIAAGQATPGPLFSTATFIGWIVGGPLAAVAATVGMFLPAFVAVAISVPVLERLRGAPAARAFLDGVNAAALALLVVAAIQLGRTGLVDPLAVVTAMAALALLLRGVGSGWLILAGLAVGIGRWLALPGPGA